MTWDTDGCSYSMKEDNICPRCGEKSWTGGENGYCTLCAFHGHIEVKEEDCKHLWQILLRPERVSNSVGDFIAICQFCLQHKFILI